MVSAFVLMLIAVAEIMLIDVYKTHLNNADAKLLFQLLMVTLPIILASFPVKILSVSKRKTVRA